MHQRDEEKKKTQEGHSSKMASQDKGKRACRLSKSPSDGSVVVGLED